MAGGKSDKNKARRKVYRFDPRSHTWLRVADMTHARESFRLCALQDRLYALGERRAAKISK